MAKRRGHGEGGVTLHKPSGRWMAHVSNGRKWDPKSGTYKRDRRYVYADTQEAAIKARDALKAELAKGVDVTNTTMLMADYLDQWLEDSVRGRVAPKTYKSYAEITRLHLKPAIGHLKIGRLNQQHIQRMLNDMEAAGLSVRTRRYVRAVLRAALSDAMRWDYVSRNVAALVKPPPIDLDEQNDRRHMSREEERRFLDHVQDDPLEYLYLVAIKTGMRQAELLGLQWADIDLDRADLRVKRTVIRLKVERDEAGATTSSWRFAPPKTRRSRRTIPLTLEVSIALAKQRELVYGPLGFRHVTGDRWEEHDLVFPSEHGTPMEPSNLTRRFRRQCRAVGIDGLTFHGLRHTTASRMATSNIPPRVVMEILGHSQIATTMETYAHVSTDEMRRALEGSDLPEPRKIRAE